MASGNKDEKKLALRIKSKKSQNSVIRDVSTKDSVKSLLAKLSEVTDVPSNQIGILIGYPPKRVTYDSANLIETLELQNQDTIIVEVETSGATKNDEEPIAATSGIGKERASTSAYPGKMKAMDASPEVIDLIDDEPMPGPSGNVPNYADLIPATRNNVGVLLRHIVPSDNSCLFSSVTFCLAGELEVDAEESSAFLREIIATTVGSNPVKFNEAMLGRPNVDYVNWIRKLESWGGGIELSILADFYGIQIGVVDTQSLHISSFGEDQNYTQRMLLIYDGIHYDPLYLEPVSGGRGRTLFDTSEEKIMELAQQLAREANASNQFTDLKNFALRCQVCNTLLKGEAEAQAHAKKTTHTNFAEIKK